MKQFYFESNGEFKELSKKQLLMTERKAYYDDLVLEIKRLNYLKVSKIKAFRDTVSDIDKQLRRLKDVK
jgi:hypothetical protein